LKKLFVVSNMCLNFIIFATVLLKVLGSIYPGESVQDIGNVAAARNKHSVTEDIYDARSGPERVDGIRKMMEKKMFRRGKKDKNTKLPPSFGGRDKGPKRRRKEKPRHVQTQHGFPGNMKVPPQEINRRRTVRYDEPPRRKSKTKPSVQEAKSEIKIREMRERKRGEYLKRRLSGTDKRRRGAPILHTFDVIAADGNTLKMNNKTFPNAKVFLIVITASDIGFSSQYVGLEKLNKDFKDQGLQIIAFPSNSFNQEPLDDNHIQSFVDEMYGVTFPVMAKCDVNGENAPELFEFLKRKSIPAHPKIPDWSPLEVSGLREIDIQWTFEKFLVYTAKGLERVMRFPYDMDPAELDKHILRAINMRAKNEL